MQNSTKQIIEQDFFLSSLPCSDNSPSSPDKATSELEHSLKEYAATDSRFLNTVNNNEEDVDINDLPVQRTPDAPKTFSYNTRAKKKTVHFAPDQGLVSTPYSTSEITLNRAHYPLVNPAVILPSSQWSYAAFVAEYDKSSITIDKTAAHRLTTTEDRRMFSEDLLKYDVVAYRFMQGSVFDGKADLEEVRESCFRMLVEGDREDREGFMLFCRLRRMLEDDEVVEDDGEHGDMWKGFGEEAKEVGEEILRRAALIEQ